MLHVLKVYHLKYLQNTLSKITLGYNEEVPLIQLNVFEGIMLKQF